MISARGSIDYILIIVFKLCDVREIQIRPESAVNWDESQQSDLSFTSQILEHSELSDALRAAEKDNNKKVHSFSGQREAFTAAERRGAPFGRRVLTALVSRLQMGTFWEICPLSVCVCVSVCLCACVCVSVCVCVSEWVSVCL